MVRSMMTKEMKGAVMQKKKIYMRKQLNLLTDARKHDFNNKSM